MNLAIILSGGTGSRMNPELPKQFLEIAGREIIARTIAAFEEHAAFDRIVIVSNPDYIDRTEALIRKEGFRKVDSVLPGGKTRQESSRIGVQAAISKETHVLIHDAARPFVSKELIDRILDGLKKCPAVLPAIPSADTVVEMNEANIVSAIPKRDRIQRVQTPQAFEKELISRSHDHALREGFTAATDDCSLVFRYQLAEVLVVPGSLDNMKITYPSDLRLAETILERK